MVLRQRRAKKTLDKIVQDLDAFPKVPDTYIEQTASGALISVITGCLVTALIWSEMNYFMYPSFNFKFSPDWDFESKLKINVDITVASPCNEIGADIIDRTDTHAFSFGSLQEENTWFELDRLQRQHFEAIRTFNEYLREEYHAIQDLLWRTGPVSLYGNLPTRRITPDDPHDACRIHGSLTLNKVAGNFHISPGKTLPLIEGHAHFSILGSSIDVLNFTHRIDKFSFGDPHGGIVQPLEGEEKISNDELMNYQYFIQVVPTDVQGFSDILWPTYQYSVKEHARSTKTGSGMPGIYFKYDVSALKVIASQDREPLFQFLVRLVAGVGGLISTSQIVCGLLKNLIKAIFCKSELEEKIERRMASLVPTSPKN